MVHFKEVAAVTDLPIILYNVPGRTGSNMTAETTLKIAKEMPQLVGVKEASGNIGQIGDILVIHDTGAHGYAMGFNYNGKLRSAELY